MASELIAEAITDYFGERCLDYAEGCPTCEAWAEYDRIYTRPAHAATDTGLVTVAWQHQDYDEWHETRVPEYHKNRGKNVRELVTRSQAAELLAAERAEHDNTIATLTSLIADNAAKDARIKELENVQSRDGEMWVRQSVVKALEAKLAAAEKALELIDKAVSEGRFIRIRKIARAALGGKPSC